jgi:hypothetical protein
MAKGIAYASPFQRSWIEPTITATVQSETKPLRKIPS